MAVDDPRTAEAAPERAIDFMRLTEHTPQIISQE
jgi:hypothetical protein